ncbi:MAG: acyl-CoA thioesterase [Verrucomicrobiota bacterium]|nr:acyl-CoA thioesterase [Verrucomicrobiota bacterium]
MTSYKVVMPEHMNQYGGLFGGYLLQWVDETAWIAVSMEYPRKQFVTIAMSQVEFRRPARGGAILRFEVEKERVGRTSVTYVTKVHCRNSHSDSDEPIFSTHITFVRLNAKGEKVALDAPADF